MYDNSDVFRKPVKPWVGLVFELVRVVLAALSGFFGGTYA